jgi:hypothetical protein
MALNALFPGCALETIEFSGIPGHCGSPSESVSATSRWRCRGNPSLGHPRSLQASFPGVAGYYFQVALSKRSSSRASQVIVWLLHVLVDCRLTSRWRCRGNRVPVHPRSSHRSFPYDLSASTVIVTSRWRCRDGRALGHPRSCRRCPFSLPARLCSRRVTACANEVSRLPCH